eukprot:11187615-Lingulodinium_polyedra.AAC.1
MHSFNQSSVRASNVHAFNLPSANSSTPSCIQLFHRGAIDSWFVSFIFKRGKRVYVHECVIE